MTESLDFGRQYRAQRAWSQLLEVFGDTVRLVGPKEAAYELDVSPTDLHNAIAERARRYPRASWTPWLVMRDPSGRAVKIYNDLCGRVSMPKATLTPEQKLRAYKLRLQSFSPELAAQLAEEIGE